MSDRLGGFRGHYRLLHVEQSRYLALCRGLSAGMDSLDHQGRSVRDSARVIIDNFAPYAKKAVVKIERAGLPDPIEVDKAEWSEGDMQARVRYPAEPLENDVLRSRRGSTRLRHCVLWLGMIAGLMQLSFLSSMAWGFEGSHDRQIEAYMAEVDLGLSAEEELALKKRIVAEGVIDRLRVGREEALTEEEVKAVRYLTRPVRAKDEANPHGQRWAITLPCPDGLPLDEVEAILASRGLTVLRKFKGYASTYFELQVPLGVDPVAEARHLSEVEAKHVDPRWGENIVGLPHLHAHPTPFAVDAAGRSKVLIGKNQIQVRFVKSLTAAEIKAFSESEHLILLDPRADFSRIGPSWTTPNGFFFIADTVNVGEMCDRLYERPEVRNVGCQAYPRFEAYIPERNDPNDPNYSSNPAHSQWYFLQNRDANGSDSDDDDSRDFDVDAPEGWNLQLGSGNTIVAIIDQGFKMDHPDLAGRWWVNLGEIPNNGIDDDGNIMATHFTVYNRPCTLKRVAMDSNLLMLRIRSHWDVGSIDRSDAAG